MTVMDHDAAAEAIPLFANVKSDGDIANAAQRLAAACGLAHYMVLDLAGERPGAIVACYSDSRHLGIDVRKGLSWLDADPVTSRALLDLVPIAWTRADYQQSPLYSRMHDTAAAAGWCEGATASAWNGVDGGVVLTLAGRSLPANEFTHPAAAPYATLAAAMLLDARKRARRVEIPRLAPREAQCLVAILSHLTVKEAARALGLEPRTVAQYLERARMKLGERTSRAAASRAERLGLIEAPRFTGARSG